MLSLAVAGATLASCCGAGLGCNAAVCCGLLTGASFLGASFLAGSFIHDSRDIGFAAATASICGAGFAVGVAVNPAVGESTPGSCVAELVEAICAFGAGFDPNKAPNNLLANEPSLSAQGTGGICGSPGPAQAARLSLAVLFCPGTARGKPYSFRRRVRCRLGRLPCCTLTNCAYSSSSARCFSRADRAIFGLTTKAGHLPFGSNTRGFDEFAGLLRIEHITAIAHLHLRFEMRRLEMIIADLEHLPEGHVRISAMPR